jgi:hypothetical protein
MSPVTRTPARASGKAVLAVCAVIGVLFVLSLYLGVLYDRATDPPHAAGSAESAGPSQPR